jgi:hypothetical protein
MKTRPANRSSVFYPLILLYTALAMLILLLRAPLFRWGVEVQVLQGSNTLLFLVAFVAAWWMSGSLRQSGGQALLKALYGGFMIRFFVLAATAFIYILSKRKQVNIPGLVGSAFFYILYLVVEIQSLRSLLKSDSANA